MMIKGKKIVFCNRELIFFFPLFREPSSRRKRSGLHTSAAISSPQTHTKKNVNRAPCRFARLKCWRWEGSRTVRKRGFDRSHLHNISRWPIDLLLLPFIYFILFYFKQNEQRKSENTEVHETHGRQVTAGLQQKPERRLNMTTQTSASSGWLSNAFSRWLGAAGFLST